MDKKKLLALLIFLIMGFFMVSFANPSEELRPVATDTKEETPVNNDANQTNVNPTRNTTNVNRGSQTIVTPVQPQDTTPVTDPTNDGIGNVDVVEYTVVFVDYANNVLKSQKVEEHSSANADDINVNDYTVAGITYSFTKWDKDFSDVTQNLTVKALYDVEKIIAHVYINGEKTDDTVEIKVNDDTKNQKDVKLTDENIDDYIVNKDELPEAKEGKENEIDKLTFDEEEGYIIEINEEFIDYNVRAFDGALVEKVEAIKAHIGDEVKLSHKDKKGYTFKYYIVVENNNKVTFEKEDTTITVHTSDIDVYAFYEVNTYEITYELDGGSTTNVTTYTVEDEVVLSDANKTGYNFTKWTENGKTITKIAKGSTGNKTIVAHYEAREDIEYTVEFYKENLTYENGKYSFVENETRNNGVADKENTIAVNKTYTGFKTPAAQKVVIAADGSTVVQFYFDREEYTVTFKNFDITNLNRVLEEKVKYEAAATTAPTLNDNDDYNGYKYTFNGWDKEFSYITGNTIVTANLTKTIIEYGITYELNGGSVETANPTSYTVVSGSIKLNNPKRDGYTFKGWSGTGLTGDNNKNVTISTGSTGARSYTANWTLNTYKINYVLNGGTVENANPTEYTYETETFNLNPASKLGYTFAGWYVNNTKVEKIEKGTTGDITLTAQYTLNTYKINYKFKVGETEGYFVEGENTNPTSFVITETPITLQDPTKTGYEFDHWELNGQKVTNITTIGDKTLYAIFTPSNNTKYSVKAYLENKDLVENVIVLENYTLYEDSKKEYTYTATATTGVNKEVTPKAITGYITPSKQTKTISANGDTTFVFLYRRETYTVKFNYKKADGTDTYEEKSARFENNVTAPANLPSYEAAGCTYSFAEWDKEFNPVISDTTVNAVYDENVITYTITFDANGGTLPQGVSNTREYTVKSVINNLPTPSKNGYTFAGWYENNTKVEKIEKETGDKTLVAHWTPVEYEISYDLKGGVVATANPTSYTVESDEITLNNPTKEGYTFKGWSGTGLTGNENTTVVIPKGSKGARSYTAHWTPIKYTINCDLDGGKGKTKYEYTIESGTFSLTAPTKTNYEFAGWTGANGTTAQKVVTIEKGTTGNKNYKAIWVRKPSNLSITTEVTGTKTTTDGKKAAEYGDELTITVTVANSVNSGESGAITLSDALLKNSFNNFEIVSAKFNNEKINEAASLINNGYKIDNVAAGQTVTVTLKVKVKGNAGSKIETQFKAEPTYGETKTATKQTVNIETTVKFTKKTEKVVGTNIILLIDESGSMGYDTDTEACENAYQTGNMDYLNKNCKSSKFINAKAAAKNFLDTVFSSTNSSANVVVSVYKFGTYCGFWSCNEDAIEIGTARNANEMNALKNDIDALDNYPYNSATPYDKAFEKAYDKLYGSSYWNGNYGLSYKNKDYNNVVIFLTDGAPDKGHEGNKELQKLYNKKTVIYSIGYGIGKNSNEFKTLKNISENSGTVDHRGKAFTSDTGLSDLNRVFNTIYSDIKQESQVLTIEGVAEMGSDVIANKPITINVTSKDKVKTTYNYNTLQEALNSKYIIRDGIKYDIDATKFNAGDKIEVIFFGNGE